VGAQYGFAVITDIRISNVRGRCWGAAFAGQNLLELLVESDQASYRVGDILMGKIERVLPGLGCVFVALELGHSGFLPIDETRYSELFALDASPTADDRNLSHALHVGSPILVQVVRAQEGDKGPRLSRRVSLTSPLVVYVPSGQGVSVSHKIKDPATRERLIDLGRAFLKGHAGALVFRTLAGRTTDTELIQAVHGLSDQGLSLVARSKRSQTIRCVEATPRAPLRWLAEWQNPNLTSVTVDNDVDFNRMHDYLKSAPYEMPLLCRVQADTAQVYQRDFQAQVERLLDRRVPLPSGGYLVIDETEALVAIDVNTGSFVGGGTGERSYFQTNLEAALVIPDELRLRQLAGMIVIDFIDLVRHEDQQLVRDQLVQALTNHGMRCVVSEFSRLGLIELSRTKLGPSLKRAIDPKRSGGDSAKASAQRLFGINAVTHIQDWLGGFQQELNMSHDLVIEVSANADTLRQLVDDPIFLQVSGKSGVSLSVHLQANPFMGFEIKVNGQPVALSVGGNEVV
jgi:Rne/Rng family ribonuclease